LTLRQLVYNLRRHWLGTVSFSAFGGLLFALALAAVVGVRFTAETRLEVREAPRPAAEEKSRPSAAQLLRSPEVLGAALCSAEVAELPGLRGRRDAVGWLRDRLEVDSLHSGALRVAVRADDPQQATVLLHAVVRAFLEDAGARHREVLRQLRQAQAEGEAKLRARQEKLARFEDPRRQTAEKDLQQAQADLHRLRVDLAIQQELARRVANQPAPEADVEEVVKQDPMLRQLRADVIEIEQELRRLERISVRGAADPAGQGLQLRLETLLRKVEQRRAEVLPGAEQRARARRRADVEAAANQLKSRLASLEDLTRTFQAEVDRLNKEAGGGDAKRLREDLLAEQAEQRKRQTRIQEVEAEGPPVRWPQDAGTLLEHDSSLRRWTAVLGGTGVCALLLMGLGLFEVRRHWVGAAADVSEGLGLPVVGWVPLVPRAALTIATAPPGRRLAEQRARLHEALDTLRTLLLRCSGDGPCLVLVSSACRGEGRTTLAAQLAASLARAWRKTLLIDADLRTPAVHERFGLPLEPGLCEVLRGECEAADVIHPTAEGRLWVMPAGQRDAHAVAALTQDGTEALFGQLKLQYDFLVLDVPPVLPVADAQVLSQYADRLLLAVRCGTSRLPAVFSASQRLVALKTPLLGAVVVGSAGELGMAANA
jgi:capsular exopolysaccharide synthesis family protein